MTEKPRAVWVRTCQECLTKHTASPPAPNQELTTAYREKKCRSCRSPGALDYGSYMTMDAQGKLVRIEDDE